MRNLVIIGTLLLIIIGAATAYYGYSEKTKKTLRDQVEKVQLEKQQLQTANDVLKTSLKENAAAIEELQKIYEKNKIAYENALHNLTTIKNDNNVLKSSLDKQNLTPSDAFPISEIEKEINSSTSKLLSCMQDITKDVPYETLQSCISIYNPVP